MINEPEQTFKCQSQVMTGLLDAYSTNMIIGGTISGQIVLWCALLTAHKLRFCCSRF